MEMKVGHFDLFHNWSEIGQWTQNLPGGIERGKCLTHRHLHTHTKYVLFPCNTRVKFYLLLYIKP